MDIKAHQKNWNDLALANSTEWVVDTRKKNWEPEDFFGAGRILIDELFGFLEQRGITYTAGRVLDFGCGPGRLTQSLCPLFDRVDGVDCSEEMIRQAKIKNRFVSSCNYFVVDTERLDGIESNSYDMVFTYSVLQHIEPYYVEKYLQSFLRILKPGGLLLFQEHESPLVRKEKIKNTIKNVLPRALVNKVKSIKNQNKPIMEVFCISRARITKIVSSFGGELLCYRAEPKASGAFNSYFYVVRKL